MKYLYEMLRESEEVPDAWNRWKEYRKELTEYILDRLSGPAHIAILGAGACHDVDVKRLLEVGNTVTLLDMNDTAMKKGIAQQLGDNPLLLRNVTCRHTNVWPVTVEEYHTLEKMLFAHCGISQIIGYLKTVLERLRQSTFSLGEEEYDIVICVGLHSQINIMFVSLLQYYMRQCRLDYTPAEVDAYLQMIVKMNRVAAEHIQKELEQAGRRFLVGYEYGSFDTADERIFEVKDLFQQGRADLAEKMQVSRVQGAVQLEQLLGAELAQNKITITDWRYFIWPFLKEKQYLMVLYEGKRI